MHTNITPVKWENSNPFNHFAYVCLIHQLRQIEFNIIMRNAESTKTNKTAFDIKMHIQRRKGASTSITVIFAILFGSYVVIPTGSQSKQHVNIGKRTCYCNSLHKIQIRLAWFCFISASMCCFTFTVHSNGLKHECLSISKCINISCESIQVEQFINV